MDGLTVSLTDPMFMSVRVDISHSGDVCLVGYYNVRSSLLITSAETESLDVCWRLLHVHPVHQSINQSINQSIINNQSINENTFISVIVIPELVASSRPTLLEISVNERTFFP